jgi:Uma2 family endonuclease
MIKMSMSNHGEDDVLAQPTFELPLPPPNGYMAEDLDRIPNLPPHTELIDGGLVFVSPQRNFHMRILRLLEHGLLRCVPEGLLVVREMSVLIGPKQRPAPDVFVASAEADVGDDQSCYPAEDVVLAVEVVAPDSEERDRKRKPLLYAEAGIEHFWRVEKEGGRIVVYTFRLDPETGAYAATGVFRERVKLSAPFDIDIELPAV